MMWGLTRGGGAYFSCWGLQNGNTRSGHGFAWPETRQPYVTPVTGTVPGPFETFRFRASGANIVAGV